ncbi:E3 ubiquitin-protein ligase UPL7 [Trifolium repens]|nr:E3 ubiquitin-protein ligase UPL7 [Trifolium repens]
MVIFAMLLIWKALLNQNWKHHLLIHCLRLFIVRVQALPNNVVVIGSHTLTDNDTKKDILVRFHDEGWELSNRKLISKKFDGFIKDTIDLADLIEQFYCDPEHNVIEMFWEVLKGFSMENQKKFLKFVTGCSRGPLLGFRYLEPLFCIQRAGGNASEDALDRLPTSATCMNLLKLPPYRSKDQLESKLLYAINADAGFDLS